MPRFDYRCSSCGLVTEREFTREELPTSIECPGCVAGVSARVYAPPAAIHFHAPGFYATDVKGTLRRRRRPNPGDDLPNRGDADTHALAKGL